MNAFFASAEQRTKGNPAGIPEEMIKEAFPEKDDADYVGFLLKKLEEDICNLCGGFGHYANTCATKRNIDRTARTAGLGHEWGIIKSSYVTQACKLAKKAKETVIKNK